MDADADGSDYLATLVCQELSIEQQPCSLNCSRARRRQEKSLIGLSEKLESYLMASAEEERLSIEIPIVEKSNQRITNAEPEPIDDDFFCGTDYYLPSYHVHPSMLLTDCHGDAEDCDYLPGSLDDGDLAPKLVPNEGEIAIMYPTSSFCRDKRPVPAPPANYLPLFLRQIKRCLLLFSSSSSVSLEGLKRQAWEADSINLLARAIHLLCRYHCTQCTASSMGPQFDELSYRGFCFEDLLSSHSWEDYNLSGREPSQNCNKALSVASATLIVIAWVHQLQLAETEKRQSVSCSKAKIEIDLAATLSVVAASISFATSVPHHHSRGVCCVHSGFAISSNSTVGGGVGRPESTSHHSSTRKTPHMGTEQPTLLEATRKVVGFGWQYGLGGSLQHNNSNASVVEQQEVESEEDDISKRKCGSLIGACSRLIHEMRPLASKISALRVAENHNQRINNMHAETQVHIRDCVAVMDLLQQFSFALFVGSAWVDEQGPLSTTILSEFLWVAHHALEKARKCAENRKRGGGGEFGAPPPRYYQQHPDERFLSSRLFETTTMSSNCVSAETSANLKSRAAQFKKLAAATACNFYTSVRPSCLHLRETPAHASPCLICTPPRDNGSASANNVVGGNDGSGGSSSSGNGTGGRSLAIYGLTRKDLEKNLFGFLASLSYEIRVSRKGVNQIGSALFETLSWYYSKEASAAEEMTKSGAADDDSIYLPSESHNKTEGSTASWSTTMIPISELRSAAGSSSRSTMGVSPLVDN